MKRFYLVLTIIALLVNYCSTDSFAVSPAENVSLPQITITTVNKVKLSTEYVKGIITVTDVDGSAVVLNAKFKMRGATALSYSSKPSLNVKLRDANGEAQDSCLLGMRSCSKWILDAMAIDRICMRNRVAMDIWNDFSSLPYQTSFGMTNSEGKTIYRSGTIGRYVEVTINDKYKGVYVLSDHINRKLLDLKKVAVKQTTANDTVRGVLYKSGTTDILNQNDAMFSDDYKTCVAAYHDAWELKEPEDYECKEAWLPLLNAMGSSLGTGKDRISTYEQVKKYFYIDNLVDYQLHTMVLAIQDNWGNKNHYFSIRNIQKDINNADAAEADKRRFVISPWDLDTSFGGHYSGNYYNGNYGPDWLPQDAVKNGGCFPFALCQTNSEYQKLLKARWQDVRKTTFHPDNVIARIEGYKDLMVNSGAWVRQAKVHPRYVEDLVKEICYIEEWYVKRYQMIDAYFGIANGIDDVAVDGPVSTAYYTVDGRKVASPVKGINIVRSSDGSVRKVYLP